MLVIWETSLSVNSILNGEVVKFWTKNQINKIEEMMNTTKALFDVKALTKYLIRIKLKLDPDLIQPVSKEEESKIKSTKYASCWFNIIKILIKYQFCSTEDVIHSKYSYSEQLFKAVDDHSKNKLTDKDDIELFKSDPRIIEIMMYIIKQLKIISIYNDGSLEFNKTKIKKVIKNYERDPQLLFKRINQIIKE